MILHPMEMRFEVDNRKIVLKGMSNGGSRVVSFKRMKRLIRHDQV